MDTRIDAWLDEELDEHARAALLQEAASDTALQAEMERAVAVRETLRALPAHACPDHIAGRVKAVARRRAADRRPHMRIARVMAPVAAAMALMVASILVFRQQQPPEPQPTAAEVQQALDEVQWAFAVVADVGRTTGETVRNEIPLHATVEPIRRAVRNVLPAEDDSIQ